jgi:predicted nucleotide-binding protein (sugar kinase/HSP70/actin superfamily)
MARHSIRITLPLLATSITATLQSERERVMKEAGLQVGQARHFRRPKEAVFTRAERGRVTVWFGGLTFRHEHLILAGLDGLGYRVALVPTPTKADFQAGKAFGNNGQCNPTYFTVGALVNLLTRMRDEQAIPVDEIIRDNVFITAGACGPCRFGMYEAEYRLALRNSGFDGFRVLLFQQGAGLNQAALKAGLEFNLTFFLYILNEIAYQIRPYEIVPGKTNEVLNKCAEICQDALREKRRDRIHGGALARLLARCAPVNGPDEAAKFLDQLRGKQYTDAFEKCRRVIDDELEVDLTRPKPICKVTGEFWAQTTEGDGNFRMFPFLESEGAEVLVEPVATWISYMLHQATKKARDRKGLWPDGTTISKRDVGTWLAHEIAYRKKLFAFALADWMIVREYNRLREAIGGTAHELANQLELTRVGHPYYNSRAGGGEGHLEVAKNIYYTTRELCHMVLSLKPFGCMPSTQSDGAQAAVTSHFKDMIYIPIETSGEGDINAHSRVQMALGEAKAKCKEEFTRSVVAAGYSLPQIRQFIAERRDLRRPLQHVTHHKGVVGKAANFVLDVAARMRAAGVKRHTAGTWSQAG